MIKKAKKFSCSFNSEVTRDPPQRYEEHENLVQAPSNYCENI